MRIRELSLEGRGEMSRPREGDTGQREQHWEGAQDPGTREHLGAGVLKGFMPP